MHPLIPWIWAAGALHGLIVLSGFFAPRVLDYRGNIAGASPTVQEVFWIHNWYVSLFVLAFSIACFAFPGELAGGSGLGRFLSGFLGAIWLLRLVIQFAYHNAEIKRSRPVMNAVFSLTFLYLGLVFTVAASGLVR